MFRVIKASTQRGQRLLESGERYVGRDLRQVYGRYSAEKENAFDRCLRLYLETPEHDAFSICTANTWTFTVSWVGLYDGENALYYITKYNDYVILLDK